MAPFFYCELLIVPLVLLLRCKGRKSESTTLSWTRNEVYESKKAKAPSRLVTPEDKTISETRVVSEGTTLIEQVVHFCHANPERISNDHDDDILPEVAQLVLNADYPAFWKVMDDAAQARANAAGFWSEWELDLANVLGFRFFKDMPAEAQQAAIEHRYVDSTTYARACCHNTTTKVVAVLEKADGTPILAPILDNDSDADSAVSRSRYIKNKFGLDRKVSEIPYLMDIRREGDKDQCMAIVLGTIDLWRAVQSGNYMDGISIGPPDSDHLMFYDFNTECRSVIRFGINTIDCLRASFYADEAHVWSLRRTQGIAGSIWNNTLNNSLRENRSPRCY